MRNFKKIICVFLAISFLTASLTGVGCSAGETKYAEFFAFDVPVRVEIRNGNLTDEITTEIDSELKRLETIFSVEQGGEAAKLSDAEANEKITVSKDFAAVLKKISSVFKLTDGKYDPTVFPLVRLWGFYPDYPVSDFAPPSDDEIKNALTHVGLNKISIISGESDSTVKTDGATQIDFGGIAKGYAADKIAGIIKSHNLGGGYINLGTSSLRLLKVESLGVRHPRKDGERILEIDCGTLTDVSVSTSGNYERFYEYDGEKYCHIIDPKNGRPANTGVESVTVICKDGALADSISTALCLCSPEEYENASSGVTESSSELADYIKKILKSQEFEGALIFAASNVGNKKRLFTNADEKSYKLLDKDYSIVKI